jgi:hypothetical protein
MTRRLPSLKAPEVIRSLESGGFKVVPVTTEQNVLIDGSWAQSLAGARDDTVSACPRHRFAVAKRNLSGLFTKRPGPRRRRPRFSSARHDHSAAEVPHEPASSRAMAVTVTVGRLPLA